MKKTFLLGGLVVFSFAFFFMACDGDLMKDTTASIENPNAKATEVANDPIKFGNTVTDLIIANNYQALTDFIIKHDEMQKAISGSTAPQNGKEFAISRIDDEIKVMQVDTKTGLDNIRSEGTAAGIVWENCTFKSATPTIDKARGFEMMTLKCVLTCNGQDHYITITDIVGTDNGWKLGGRLYFGDPKPATAQPQSFTPQR